MISYFFLDIRPEAESRADRVPGSVNIPYGEVVNNLSKIPRSSKVVVYCGTGQKSSIVSSVLKKLNFDVIDAKGMVAANDVFENMNRI